MRYLIISFVGLLLLSSCSKELYYPIEPVSVTITDWDTDSDGLVNAAWVYSDKRIGGTDWTDIQNLNRSIDEQISWSKCKKCWHVTQQIICWRHE